MSCRSQASPSSRAWVSADSDDGLADEHVGRMQPQNRRHSGIEHVVGRHQQQADAPFESFCGREHLGKERLFARRRLDRVRVVVTVEADEADGHHA